MLSLTYINKINKKINNWTFTTCTYFKYRTTYFNRSYLIKVVKVMIFDKLFANSFPIHLWIIHSYICVSYIFITMNMNQYLCSYFYSCFKSLNFYQLSFDQIFEMYFHFDMPCPNITLNHKHICFIG